ncbi:MAG: hypothetical protein WBH45_08585, partial [Acidobacteriaceae bacterium]
TLILAIVNKMIPCSSTKGTSLDRFGKHSLNLPVQFAAEAEEPAFWESHPRTGYIDRSRARATAFPTLRQTPQSNPGEPTPTPNKIGQVHPTARS